MTIRILEDIRTARQHPGVAALGALLGGFPPASAYLLTHNALPDLWRSTDSFDRILFWALVPVVLACLTFSVRKVWQWGEGAFGEQLIATCLVVALEGTMVFSPLRWHAVVALAYLILINAIASACTLVAHDKTAPPATVAAVALQPSQPRKVVARPVERQLVKRPAT